MPKVVDNREFSKDLEKRTRQFSEAGEIQYWLEVIVEAKWLPWEKIQAEYEECNELLALFTSIGKGTKL